MRSPMMLAAAIFCASSLSGALAQQPGPPSSPYQQRLSPYLDLLRADNSVLHPYHSFVLPRRDFQQRLRLQAAQIGQLQQTTSRLQSQSPSSIAPRMQTGRGGRFQSYLHFYPMGIEPNRR